jgi:hypothetical protein
MIFIYSILLPRYSGSAWVHMRAFHAFTPHVIVDTRLIVRDFNIRCEQHVSSLIHAMGRNAIAAPVPITRRRSPADP